MRVESISALDVSLYMGTLISEQALLVGDLWDRGCGRDGDGIAIYVWKG